MEWDTKTTDNKTFKKILIANRGVAACRIIKTCCMLQIPTLAIYTHDDQHSQHVKEATESHLVSSYLDIDAIIEIAKTCKAEAIHPGYGFLSENPLFPETCEENSIAFLGPAAKHMKAFSLKHEAKKLAEKVKVPIVNGSGVLKNVEEALTWATEIGFPVILKPSAGGGGIGMYVCNNKKDLTEKFNMASHQSLKFFKSADIYLEKYICVARHIEVQIFGDGKGNVIHLQERECSIQRRQQKIVEESPSPGLTHELRQQVWNMAVQLGKSVSYKSAGTVEFLYDEQENKFYFLEVNTRLQVEHRITEMRYGIDLVEWMINLGYENNGFNIQSLLHKLKSPRGHAIECRLCAENPLDKFLPSSGKIENVNFPVVLQNARIDTWISRGCEVSSKYDALLANIIQWGPTRSEATRQILKLLTRISVDGVITTLEYCKQLLKSEMFTERKTYISSTSTFNYSPYAFEVLSPGLHTLVQDWPGRSGRGLWRVGVPPSGPMDHLASRIANVLVYNSENDAVLEITQVGPTLKFHAEALIAITGAAMDVTLNNKTINMWRSIKVQPGSILKIGCLTSSVGSRSYLSVHGGIDVPLYLGSRSTFVGGNFGGYKGRALKSRDVITIGPSKRPLNSYDNKQFDFSYILSQYSNDWKIGVLPGPHANPEFLTDADVEMFYNTKWVVHYNSNRLGIRLSGPAPQWARTDGGEGGSHPSNIHDCEYAVGTVNFTGNMPIIIAQDGPSLGGFVCPSTIVQSELWKIGQVKSGDTIQFRKMTIDEAVSSRLKQNHCIMAVQPSKEDGVYPPKSQAQFPLETSAILREIPKTENRPKCVIRLAGDSYVLIEYGLMELDLKLRFRIHFLEKWFLEHDIIGLEETAPGVRSLQIRYNPLVLPLGDLVDLVVAADGELADVNDMTIRSRILHLPMCFDYSGIGNAVQKYMKSIRAQAPYLPHNIDYVAKNNGLNTTDEVKDKVFSASYMCLGLGDVYLGACCAVPVNPLDRLVTSKYNPARTFTQEGTVGLGGSYMCIYPMDSPGGYQLVGRTLPIWDTFGNSNPKYFKKEKPWLLEMFDQIKFYSVTEEHLDSLRSQFSTGQFDIEIEHSIFDISKYNNFVKSIEGEVSQYRKKQEHAASIMLQKEQVSLDELEKAADKLTSPANEANDEGYNSDKQLCVSSTVTGKIWEVLVSVGDSVLSGQTVAVVEAMKMECSCSSPIDGVISHCLVTIGQFVHQGDHLFIISK